MPESLEAVVDLLVPELQSRGVFKTDYAAGPLRQKIFGAPRLRIAIRLPNTAFRPNRRHGPPSSRTGRS